MNDHGERGNEHKKWRLLEPRTENDPIMYAFRKITADPSVSLT